MCEWKTKTLGEVLVKTATTDPSDAPEDEFDYIDVSSVSNLTYSIETTQRLRGKDAPSRARKLVRTGDVLFATIRPTLKRIAVVPSALDGQVCSTGYFLLRPTGELDQKFLFYSLFTPAFMGAMEALQKGASYPAVTDAQVRAQPISYPPLTEQQRIVAMLDEAFEDIATAKANAEKNLNNARELFESRSRSVFSQRTQGAMRRQLTEVCSIDSKLIDPRDAQFLDLTHVGAGNIISNTGEFVELKTVREEELISGKFLFDESAVLYSKIRPYLKKVARPAFSGLCSADMYPLIAKPSEMSRDYLFHLLLSEDFTDYAISGSARAGMPKVNRDHLFAYTAWIPPISQQIEIAKMLDALHAKSLELEAIYVRKLALLNEFKESLLHQAFSGQLKSSTQTSVARQPLLQTTTPEFAANVIAISYARHERQRREKTFGRVKEQKVLHLVEAIANIDMGRQPLRDAAGPNDFQHMLKAEEWARSHKLFEMINRGRGYELRKLSAFDEYLSSARQALAPYLPQLEPVIDLLVPMDTEEAEVFATVHAAWNNLLLDGIQATDDAIVSAARDDWHPDKLNIPEHKFRSAIELLRQKKLVPDGSAKYVGGQQSLL